MLTALPKIKITVLIDNTSNRPGLVGEHGLSLFIETPDASILFDTGASKLIVSNASALGIDLARISAIILSHGHYDHTGGLEAVLDISKDAVIHTHPDTFGKHYGLSKDRKLKNGSSPLAENDLNARNAQIRYSRDACILYPGIATTGEIPRITDYEDTGGSFYQDEDYKVVDLINDDQALVIKTASNVILLLGCAHSGVVNTLEHVHSIFGFTRIDVIMGGMHLLNASEVRLGKTAEALKRFKVGQIGPMHCTGGNALQYLARSFPEKTFFPGVGDFYEF